MIIWFWYQIVSLFFCCYKFDVLMFLNIFHSFSENWIFHQLEKKIFFFWNHFFVAFLRLVFISIHGFNQAFWLNLMTLGTVLKTKWWFNACFIFLMWITCPVLSYILGTSFLTFSIFIHSGKNGKWLWRSHKFSRCWISTSRKYLHHFLHYNFL